MEKEHEAHKALGDSASLMGQYDVKAEEDAIREVLAGRKALDDVVKTVDEVTSASGTEGLLARLFALGDTPKPESPPETSVATSGVYDADLPFLRDALVLAFETPGADPERGGVSWREHTDHALVEMVPSKDLRQRLEVLPQSYLRERKVLEKLTLATSAHRGEQALDAARRDDENGWPEAHYLSPLHPTLEWAADRALESLGRNEVFAVIGDDGRRGIAAPARHVDQHPWTGGRLDVPARPVPRTRRRRVRPDSAARLAARGAERSRLRGRRGQP